MTTEIIPTIKPDSSEWEVEDSKLPVLPVVLLLLAIAFLLTLYFYTSTDIFRKENFLWSKSNSRTLVSSETSFESTNESCFVGGGEETYWRLRGDGGWELATEESKCR